MLKSVEDIRIRRRLIKTRDGAELIGKLFEPSGLPRAAIVLSGATGVPQGYYHAFATWAAVHEGYAVLTYDYRDMGLSARQSIRQSRATLSDWVLRDSPAARKFMKGAVPGVPLWTLGHSLGGMLLPMQDDIVGIDRAISVASGLVHFTDHPWPYRARAMVFWFALGPLLAASTGYVSGQVSGFGSDLPGPAFWEWRKWCTQAGIPIPDVGCEFLAPDWSRSGAPVRLVTFTDDDLIPHQCAQRLLPLYSEASVRHDTLDPRSFGLSSIGHLGAFHRKNAAVWQDLLR